MLLNLFPSQIGTIAGLANVMKGTKSSQHGGKDSKLVIGEELTGEE